MFFIEKIGRRKLVVCSLLGIIIGLIIIGLGFAVNKAPVDFYPTKNRCSRYSTCYDCIKDSDCGFCFISMGYRDYKKGSCLTRNASHVPEACTSARYGPTQGEIKWSPTSCPTSHSSLTIFGMIFFLAMFAPGMGPMPWVVNSEIYPLWARSTGSACATAVNWIFNLLISLTFLDLMENITKQGTFFLYCGISMLGLVSMFLFLPETKGLGLEEVEDLFKGPLIVPFRNRNRIINE